MLEFLVLEKLEHTDAFPYHDVTSEMIIKGLNIKSEAIEPAYLELIEPLKKIKRYDLVNAIEYKLDLLHKKNSKIETMLAKVNHKVFDGKLRSLLP